MSTPSLRKKRRPVRSCNLCRARRVKCDQSHPRCSNCVKADVVCEYSGSTPGDVHQPAEASASTQPQIDHNAAALTTSNIAQPLGPPVDLGVLTEASSSRAEYLGPSFWANSSNDIPELGQLIDGSDGPDARLLCESCKALQQWSTRDQSSPLKGLAAEALRCSGVHGLGQMLDKVPPRETCNRLWGQFLISVYPLLPILHLPTFWQDIDAFWDSIHHYYEVGVPTGILGRNPMFLAVVFATLFCGSIGEGLLSRKGQTNSKQQSRLAKRMYRNTVTVLSLCGFPRSPTISSLQAFVMCHVPLIREESERSATFVSTAFRVGQALGLHRDPSHFKLTSAECEERRRLWWHIVHKDSLSSSVSGLPQMMWDRQQHDTLMICELNDLEFNRETNASGRRQQKVAIHKHSSVLDYRELDATTDIRQMVSVARFLTTNAMRDVLGRQMDLEPWSVETVQHFERLIHDTAEQVRGRIAKLQFADETVSPSDLDDVDWSNVETVTRMREDSVHAWSFAPTAQNIVFIKWSAGLMNLMIERMHCTLYHPLWKCKDPSLWHLFRQSAVAHCHAYIEHYVKLCTEPDFSSFHWMYPGSYQPLQALMMLLTDLSDNPLSEEAVESRRLVDCIFSLLGPNNSGVVAENGGHLSKRRLPASGRNCWVLLSALRRRAWRKMNVDPGTIWTCARRHTHARSEDEASDDDGEDSEDTARDRADDSDDMEPLLTAAAQPIGVDGEFDLLFGNEANFGNIFHQDLSERGDFDY